MGAPKITIREFDLSTRVESSPGVYGGILISGAPRGPVGELTLVTSEVDFLETFTITDKVGVNDAGAFFSALAFLEKSNKLWVGRVVGAGATYGGLLYADGGSVSAWTGAAPTPTFSAPQMFLLYGSSPGSWSGAVSVAISSYTKTPTGNAFQIRVYKGGELKETWVVALSETERDGWGRNLFMEDVLEASKYIRAVVNPARTNSTYQAFSAQTLTAGANGSTPTDGNMLSALALFESKSSIPLTVLMDGGYGVEAYQQAMVTLCENRKDCVAFLSVPNGACRVLSDVTDYRASLATDSSYAALYAPFVKIYDKFNDRYVEVSPEGFVAAALSDTAEHYAIWYPIGGFQRGRIPVRDVVAKYSEGTLDNLYDNEINAIKWFPGQGMVIWGQKTLQLIASATDRLNVRLLLNEIELNIGDSLNAFLFELNDESTRALVNSMISAYMEDVKARRGVTAFSVVCDETNNTPAEIDNNRLIVHLFLTPTHSVEEIKFNLVITSTGVDFKTS